MTRDIDKTEKNDLMLYIAAWLSENHKKQTNKLLSPLKPIYASPTISGTIVTGLTLKPE